MKEELKGRFYIQCGEILDSGFFIGSSQEIVNILNKQDEELEELKHELERIKEINLYNKDLAKNSLQQLKEKDEEIKALKYLCGCPNDINEMIRKVVYRDQQIVKQYDFFQEQLKSNTHQVCERIKEWLKQNLMMSGGKATELDIAYAHGYNDCRNAIKKLLDQIEKGEDNGSN